ncbi:MAG: glycosyltransferase family 2 protein [Rhodospirillales bacterium]|nr:MAG: glycosyltransferase family 2 protein [Rhodospirillales bacterium]
MQRDPSSTRFPTVSVVVPTFRERDNLEPLITRIEAALADSFPDYEIVIVDDDSGDGTEALIAALQDRGSPVRLIVRRTERGLSSAVLRGFEEANGAYLVCMDADLSHPPEALPEMLAPLIDGRAEFTIGSRYVAGGSIDGDWGLFRWLNSKVATVLARPFTRVRDPMSGCFAMPRTVFARARDLNPVGYKIGLELLVKCECRTVEEVPIHFADRQAGESKLSIREQFNYGRHIKRLFDYKYGPVSRFLQFCMVGGTGVVVDLLIYAFLLGMGVSLGVARAGAILSAMTSNFTLNRYVTFSYSRKGDLIRQYLRFVATSALGAVLSWGISVSLTFTIPFFQDRIYLAALIGILVGTISNFLFSFGWVFRKDRPAWRGSLRR